MSDAHIKPHARCIVRVVSMRRSGQHAVMHWVADNSAGTYLMLNDVHINVSPFRTPRGRHRYGSNSRLLRQAPALLGRLWPKQLLIYNHEDACLPEFCSYGLDATRAQTRYSLLVLRDAFNLFASRLAGLHHYSEHGRVADIYKAMWRLHADEYRGRTRYLDDCVPVSFNRWPTDPGYQASLAERLGLVLRSRGTPLTRQGGGSSFDTAGDFDPQNLCSRFVSQLDNPIFRQAFAGEHELLEINLELFGDSLWPHRDRLHRLVRG